MLFSSVMHCFRAILYVCMFSYPFALFRFFGLHFQVFGGKLEKLKKNRISKIFGLYISIASDLGIDPPAQQVTQGLDETASSSNSSHSRKKKPEITSISTLYTPFQYRKPSGIIGIYSTFFHPAGRKWILFRSLDRQD